MRSPSRASSSQKSPIALSTRASRRRETKARMCYPGGWTHRWRAKARARLTTETALLATTLPFGRWSRSVIGWRRRFRVGSCTSSDESTRGSTSSSSRCSSSSAGCRRRRSRNQVRATGWGRRLCDVRVIICRKEHTVCRGAILIACLLTFRLVRTVAVPLAGPWVSEGWGFWRRDLLRLVVARALVAAAP